MADPNLANLSRPGAACRPCTKCVRGHPSTGDRAVSPFPVVTSATCALRKVAGQRLALGVLCKQGVGGSSPLVSTSKALGRRRLGPVTLPQHREEHLSESPVLLALGDVFGPLDGVPSIRSDLEHRTGSAVLS